MKKVAITGGIGSGKSTVLQTIKNLGYPVFSCDEINGELIRQPEYVKKIATLFPSCVKEKEIDKETLAKIIFSDDAARKKLNQAAHPLIMQRLLSKIDECKTPLVFAEVPLLFEGDFVEFFDIILIVTRPLEDRIKSIVKRDKIDCERAKERILAQFDYSLDKVQDKAKNRRLVYFDNDEPMAEIKNKIQKIIETL